MSHQYVSLYKPSGLTILLLTYSNHRRVNVISLNPRIPPPSTALKCKKCSQSTRKHRIPSYTAPKTLGTLETLEIHRNTTNGNHFRKFTLQERLFDPKISFHYCHPWSMCCCCCCCYMKLHLSLGPQPQWAWSLATKSKREPRLQPSRLQFLPPNQTRRTLYRMHPPEALRNPESSRNSENSSYWRFGEASMACLGDAKERLLRWLRSGEERHR